MKSLLMNYQSSETIFCIFTVSKTPIKWLQPPFGCLNKSSSIGFTPVMQLPRREIVQFFKRIQHFRDNYQWTFEFVKKKLCSVQQLPKASKHVCIQIKQPLCHSLYWFLIKPVLSGQALLSSHLPFPWGWLPNRGSTIIHLQMIILVLGTFLCILII